MTDTSTVYMLLGVGGALLAISIFCLYAGRVNAITVATMIVPAIICWKVSNLYIDGTLTTVNRFLGSDNAVVTMTETVRDPAVSLIFQLVGIILILGTLLQIYTFFHETKILSEFEMGDD